VQIQGALSALEDALKAGYEDFKVISEYSLSFFLLVADYFTFELVGDK
jgi:hypothetical protein